MISSLYIALCNQRFEIEFRLLRYLVGTVSPELREAFVGKEVRRCVSSYKKWLDKKADRDELDDLSAQVIGPSHQGWLARNLYLIHDFSENRLRQMELVLRYAISESFLLKTVGNVLWEYPDLRTHPIHEGLQRSKVLRFKQRHRFGSLKDRVAWTRSAVDAVDRMPLARLPDDDDKSDRVYLATYLADCFGLEFGQAKICGEIERARRTRNRIIHQDFHLVISEQALVIMASSLGDFPVLLVKAASEKYPKACTTEPPEEDDKGHIDDGAPPYEILAEILKL